ncbi:MAG: YgaP family membrane protein [Pseudomonadota bacterium]
MTCNMSNTDRIIRAIVGVVLLVIAFTTLTAIWAWVAGVIGAVLVATAAVGYCPAYSLFGMRT